MLNRYKIMSESLTFVEFPFFPSKTIFLKNIRSVEVYGKSIIPPLVIAIILLVVHVIMLNVLKNTFFFLYILMINNLIILNTPVIFCVLLALLRSKFMTLQITLESNKTLQLHFISRSFGEKDVNDLRNIISNHDKLKANVN